MADLLCGSAELDITPYEYLPGEYMAGFESERRATAVLDPIGAGALVLDDGKTRLALVSVDVIGLQNQVVNRIRQQLADEFSDVNSIIVASTHNHQGPDTLGLWGKALFGRIPIRSGVNRKYLDALVDRLTELVRSAARNTKTVTVKASRFDVPPDWFRNDRKGGGKDDFGWALAFDATDGSGRVATLVNFAAHPETLWEGNTLISADYPGATRQRLRETSGGVPVFFSGALGAMVTPNIPRDTEIEQRKAAITRLGTGIADLARSSLEGATPIRNPSLRLVHLPLELPLENRMFKFLKVLGIMNREFVNGRVQTEMNMVMIGEDVSIITAPGECSPEVGRDLVAVAPGTSKFLFGLGCDELGYIITPGQFENSEYGYEKTMSIGPRTATLLVEAVKRMKVLP